jgi:hypothetical protein
LVPSPVFGSSPEVVFVDVGIGVALFIIVGDGLSVISCVGVKVDDGVVIML